MEITNEQLVGFFFGEGCIDLTRSGRPITPSVLRLRIGLHESDKPILEAIMERYGGCLSFTKSAHSWTWQLRNRTDVRRVLNILAKSTFPSNKRPQVLVALEAMALHKDRGAHLSECTKETFFALRNKLKALKKDCRS